MIDTGSIPIPSAVFFKLLRFYGPYCFLIKINRSGVNTRVEGLGNSFNYIKMLQDQDLLQ